MTELITDPYFLQTPEGLKTARKLLKMTQPQLAEKLGWVKGKRHIYSLERGERHISRKTARALWRLLCDNKVNNLWLEAINQPMKEEN
ncbi:MAG: hypothetical protein COA71_14685 [SAR86 cluster bacterium]|uniref:HTH cro/C1-type domain-containing protein n=1 Tax=SAR86 cluster bacterium TaxID=2030880 RepID=A0A2A5C6D3_9GAMM|nr:MAG: hypothetical protein COA71_14685 [SAR86 cluster bacterium]